MYTILQSDLDFKSPVITALHGPVPKFFKKKIFNFVFRIFFFFLKTHHL